MSKVIRIISASVMLTVLSAIILAGCGNRHSDKAGLNKSDITETLSQTLESEKDSQMNSRSEENTRYRDNRYRSRRFWTSRQ